MKKLLIVFGLTILCLQTGFSQTPQGFNYQALARDADGVVLSEKELGVLISIVKSNADGDIVYSEIHTPQTNAQGIFNVQVGSGAAQTGVFEQIDWGTDTYFIAVSISIDASSTDFKLVGTQQLLSVPYALFANESANGNNTPLTCPAGFEAVNDKYCIQKEEQTALNWFEANVQCAELNAEICSWSEWYVACQKSSLNLSNMTDNWEWINDGGDDQSNHAKAVGEGKCTSDNSFKAELSTNAFRCCFSR